MIDFDPSFFEGETRDEFYIEPMMKRAWAVELEVLSQVSAVCKKYDIPYFASYGTLLGAIRHQGYIPWDDDIDIALKRPDYLRLLNLLPQELPEGYFVNSYYTCETHKQPWASVVNTRYMLNDADKIRQFWGCPYVCGIDIFPMDFVSKDAQEDDMQMNLYEVVFNVAYQYDEYEASGELYEYLPRIEQMCGVTLNDDGTLRRQLRLLADQIAGLFPEEECDELTLITSRLYRNDRNFKFSKVWYQQTKEVPFENIAIAVPVEYDRALRVFYGDNYMTPIRCGGNHEYPFYKSQQRFLDENHIILPR